jgi:uncharacterized membrane protein YqiK
MSSNKRNILIGLVLVIILLCVGIFCKTKSNDGAVSGSTGSSYEFVYGSGCHDYPAVNSPGTNVTSQGQNVTSEGSTVTSSTTPVASPSK